MFFRCDILSMTRALLLGTPLIPVEGDSAFARRILGLVDCRLSYALVCARRCIVGGADPAHLSLWSFNEQHTSLPGVVALSCFLLEAPDTLSPSLGSFFVAPPAS